MAAAGNVSATYSALAGGAALGLDFQEIVDLVMSLTPAGGIYLKLTVIEAVLIVSFEEL